MQNEYYDDQWGLTQKDLKFGARVHQKVLSNIHDHLTSWKVDFDINGTANSFHRTVDDALPSFAPASSLLFQTSLHTQISGQAHCRMLLPAGLAINVQVQA